MVQVVGLYPRQCQGFAHCLYIEMPELLLQSNSIILKLISSLQIFVIIIFWRGSSIHENFLALKNFQATVHGYSPKYVRNVRYPDFPA